jgi:hypothetical protein
VRVSIRRAALAAVLLITGGTIGLAAPPAHAFAIYVVTNTNDSGTGSLRDAITDANANPGIDSIVFAIPGTGAQVITPLSDLPAITDPLIVSGYTQPGSAPATATSLATVDVVINAVNTAAGLVVQTNGSTVAGLVVHNVPAATGRCGGAGICVLGNNNTIRGDYVGVGTNGTAALPNAGDGVYVKGDGNWIGSAAVGDRNVVSGNGRNGVAVDGKDNHVVGNRIGTRADGTAALGNGLGGVRLDGGAGHVGGTAAGAGNLISGNTGDGIEVGASANGCEILGNLVGVNAAATGALPNGTGVELHSNNNIVGGTEAGATNMLSGNTQDGLDVDVPSAGNTIQGNLIGNTRDAGGVLFAFGNGRYGMALLSGIASTVGGTVTGAGNTISGNRGTGIWVPGDNQVIQGNLVGVAVTATGALVTMPNLGDGIRVFADDVQVGGDLAGAGNTISGNVGNGVTVGPIGTDSPILGNSIYDNVAMGIDLLPVGPTPNDPQDGDTGADDLQNTPIVAGAVSGVGTTTVGWTLNSTPGTTFRLEFFAGAACAAAGATFLGATGATTGPAGNAVAPPGGTILGVSTPPGTFVVATATEITAAGTFGSTSEFSNCVPVT